MQAGTLLKFGPVAMHEFQVFNTAVGTIEFNENMLIQVFSQDPAKILNAFFNVGEHVKQDDVLFTIDSRDLLRAESNLLVAVLALQKKTLARVKDPLQAGGSARKDVDQATSDEQTAEGNFKAAKDALRISGEAYAKIERLLANPRIQSTLVVPSPFGPSRSAQRGARVFDPAWQHPAPFQVADISTMWMTWRLRRRPTGSGSRSS